MEALKNGIMIPIDTSKESNFYADFKYINPLSFALLIKSYEPKKIYLVFEKEGNIP